MEFVRILGIIFVVILVVTPIVISLWNASIDEDKTKDM